MSTQTKSGGGGGRKANKAANSNTTHADNTSKKVVSDHNKTEKEKPQIKPTAEQIRIAQITDIKSNVEDPKIREKVDQLMETTQRSEEDVCYALYECDNDVEKAVIYLLETLEVGAFATTSKKKKNRSAAAASTNDAAGGTIGGDDWEDMTNNNTSVSLNSNNTNSNNIGDNRDRSRGRGGMRGNSGRGGRMGPRGDNNNDGRMGNDRSGMDKGGDNTWRGGRGGNRGSSRGGFGTGSRGGGRGGRMGGMGPRTQNTYRDNHRNNYRNTQEIDSWDSSQINTDIITNKNEDTWGDWDNEEYTGSLSDTKVFTPSSANQGSVSNPSDLSAPPGLEQQILSQQTSQNDVQQYSTTVASSTSASGVNNNVQYPELHSASTAAQHLRQALEKTMPQLSQTTSLSAEQSQYFNTLSSQNANVNSYQTSSVQYQYGDHQVSASQAPAVVRRQRVRVPPPSKIPSSAVEMPGDLNSMGFLDVQFGGLEFGTEESIENVADKFSSTSIDVSHGAHQQTNDVSDYQSKLTNTGVSKPSQSSLTSGLGQPTSLMQNTDSMTSTQNDNLTSSYAASRSTNNVLSNSGSNLDPLVKSDPYSQSTNQSSATSYQNMSYSTSNKTSSYQPSSGPGVYNNNSYNSSQQQVSSTNSYPPSSNTYNSYNQSSYQQQSQQTQNNQQQTQPSQNSQQPLSQSSLSSASSVVVNNANVVGVSGNPSNPNIPVNSAGANSTANSNYLSNQYSVSQTSGYPTQQSYQTNQSVYGNSGLNNNTGYSGTGTSTVPYSNFNSKLKDTPASTTFDNSSSNSVSSGVTNAVSNNSAITTSSISSPSSLGLTNTKATTNSSMKSGTGNSATSASSGSGANNNVVQNIPVVSQFIQTTGVPFYQQQYVQYEDIQLVPPRMTHMPGYYDLSNVNYPTPPTSLGAAGVRDGATGNLATVAYSTMTDGRFTRTDNNSSPVSNVPSTISQQTGSAGGPMLNIPPYTTVPYYFGANMMAGGFQQAYPQIYPQQMATNPNSGGQYAKPSFYSSGSTGYDTIGQTPQDYNKTAYPSGGVSVSQQQAKGQSVSNQSGGNSDIASSMYSSKSHVALNKVNSYDKQSFHSGTPPPFNLAGSQTANSQTQAAYGQHLFIPAAITAHHIHQPMHQIDGSGRLTSSSRRDTNNSGQRQQCTSQSKAQSKSGYSQSYWATQN